MKKKIILSIVLVTALLAFAAGLVFAATGGVTDPETLAELAQARQATTKYHDVAVAEADGYVPVSPYVPGMGIHYLNQAVIGPFFSPETPGILLYAPAGQGRLRLVGVEYIVLDALLGPGFSDGLPDNEPDGFTGDSDSWEFHQAECHYTDGSEGYCASPADADPAKTLALWHPDIWLLHVWLWQANPDGIFEDFNPTLP